MKAKHFNQPFTEDIESSRPAREVLQGALIGMAIGAIVVTLIWFIWYMALTYNF